MPTTLDERREPQDNSLCLRGRHGGGEAERIEAEYGERHENQKPLARIEPEEGQNDIDQYAAEQQKGPAAGRRLPRRDSGGYARVIARTRAGKPRVERRSGHCPITAGAIEGKSTGRSTHIYGLLLHLAGSAYEKVRDACTRMQRLPHGFVRR